MTPFDPEEEPKKDNDWFKLFLFCLVLLLIGFVGFLLYEKTDNSTGLAVLELKNQESFKISEDFTLLNSKLNNLEEELSRIKSEYKKEVLTMLNSCSVEELESDEASCDEVCYGVGPRKTCTNAFFDNKPSECKTKNKGKITCTCCKTE